MYFANTSIGDDDAKRLAQVLPLMKTLKELELEGVRIQVTGANILWQQFTALDQLKGLHLSNNNLGSVGAAALGPHLTVLTQLQVLDLKNNHVGAAGTVALIPYLSNLTQLEKLYLSGNNVGAEGAQLLSGLAALRNLHVLVLSDNSFHPRDVKLLRNSLKSLTLLHTLDLDVGSNECLSSAATVDIEVCSFQPA